ncbi:MAG: M48 family metalloprotease [Mariprofundaceae bacterium]
MKHILIYIALSLLLTSCATNPVSNKSEFVLMSEKQELKIGQQLSKMVAREMTLLPDHDPLVQYVNRIGQKMAAVSDRTELFYRFHVVDDGTINAFALPGGHIYIHRGLLTHFNSEAELAAVLGHEIGHVTARHAVRRHTQAQAYKLGMVVASVFAPIPRGVSPLTDLLAQSIIMGFGREQELQSDTLSLSYLARAGYDVHATINMLETLGRLSAIRNEEKRDAGEEVKTYHGAFSSHPETKKRIEEAVAKAAAMQTTSHPRTGHLAMLNALQGHTLKDNPKDGAVMGHRFIHPDLGLQLEFPDDWVINNTKSALTARVRKEKVFFKLSLLELQKRTSATDVMKSLLIDRHIKHLETGTMMNGLPFARGISKESAPHVSLATIDTTVWLDGPQAFILSMWSKRDEYETWKKDFASIHASIKPYHKKNDGRDVPRIMLYIWQVGDSWQSLARKSGHILGRFTAKKLAALNGKDINTTPRKGEQIKIIH